MSNVHALETHAPNFDDDAWDDLLNFIEEKRVIPIIGPELLKVETETGPRLFYDWLAFTRNIGDAVGRVANHLGRLCAREALIVDRLFEK